MRDYLMNIYKRMLGYYNIIYLHIHYIYTHIHTHRDTHTPLTNIHINILRGVNRKCDTGVSNPF